MQIPMRCVHCGCVLEAWDPYAQFCSACHDCQAWEAWLWRQRQAQRVAEAALLTALLRQWTREDV
jgi:hypothetical protein